MHNLLYIDFFEGIKCYVFLHFGVVRTFFVVRDSTIETT